MVTRPITRKSPTEKTFPAWFRVVARQADLLQRDVLQAPRLGKAIVFPSWTRSLENHLRSTAKRKKDKSGAHFNGITEEDEDAEENGAAKDVMPFSRVSAGRLASLTKGKSSQGEIKGPAIVSANMFWKVPMPTRKNTVMPPKSMTQKVEKDDDESDEEQEEEKVEEEVEALPRKPPIRKSVLAVFSNESTKTPGLYALPKEGAAGEVVEVRRGSLMMSTAMLNDILRSKFDAERIEGIAEHDGDWLDDMSTDEAVVLPFFGPTGNTAFRQCRCKTDPVTGHVIHTCMTPAGTMAMNTNACQSYVCSAWNSKAPSTRHSQSGSRRGSEGADTIAPLPKKAPSEKSKNRIRNASMLAIVGNAGPAPGKQDTDDPIDKEKKEDVTDGSDDEKGDENELAVSFKNITDTFRSIADSLENKPETDRGAEGNVEEPVVPNSDDYSAAEDDLQVPHGQLDQKAESELGHKFELIEPWTLATWLKDGEIREQLLVVDVRGRDWVGGHIPASINLHTSELVRHPESLLVQCRRNRIHHIVFSCMYSVMRARKCAIAVEKAQADEQKAGHAPYRLRISLLRGGVHGWVNHFIGTEGVAKASSSRKANPYVDNFDAECWCDGGPSQGGLVHQCDALWSAGGQKALCNALTSELESLLVSRSAEERNSVLSMTEASPPLFPDNDGDREVNEDLYLP